MNTYLNGLSQTELNSKLKQRGLECPLCKSIKKGYCTETICQNSSLYCLNCHNKCQNSIHFLHQIINLQYLYLDKISQVQVHEPSYDRIYQSLNQLSQEFYRNMKQQKTQEFQYYERTYHQLQQQIKLLQQRIYKHKIIQQKFNSLIQSIKINLRINMEVDINNETISKFLNELNYIKNVKGFHTQLNQEYQQVLESMYTDLPDSTDCEQLRYQIQQQSKEINNLDMFKMVETLGTTKNESYLFVDNLNNGTIINESIRYLQVNHFDYRYAYVIHEKILKIKINRDIINSQIQNLIDLLMQTNINRITIKQLNRLSNQNKKNILRFIMQKKIRTFESGYFHLECIRKNNRWVNKRIYQIYMMHKSQISKHFKHLRQQMLQLF